jgi:hypothetical protein
MERAYLSKYSFFLKVFTPNFQHPQFEPGTKRREALKSGFKKGGPDTSFHVSNAFIRAVLFARRLESGLGMMDGPAIAGHIG